MIMTASRVRTLFGNKRSWEGAIRQGAREVDHFDFGDFEKISQRDWNEYDYVVPLMLDDYPALWRAGDQLAGKVIYPPEAAVALCDDKATFNRTLSHSPFGTMIPRLVEDGGFSSFPCILKKSHDDWGENSVIVHSEDDLAKFETKIISGEYFLQDYIIGSEERATHLLLRDGQIVFSFDVVYDVADHPFVKGKWQSSRSMTTGAKCPYLTEFLEMLDFIGFHDGTCCFDYKVSNGIPQIFEINPRFGGSLLYDVGNYLRSYRDAVPGWSRPPAADRGPILQR